MNDEFVPHSPATTPRIPTLDDLHRLNTELDEIDQTLAELDAPRDPAGQTVLSY